MSPSKDPGPITDPFSDTTGSDTTKAPPGAPSPTYLETADLGWSQVPSFYGTVSPSPAAESPLVAPGTQSIELHFATLKASLEVVREKVADMSTGLDAVVAQTRDANGTDGFWGEKAIAVGQNDSDGVYTNANGDSYPTSGPQTKQPDPNIRGAADAFGPVIRHMMEQASQQAANSLYLVGQWMAQVHSCGEALATVDTQLGTADVPAPIDPTQIKSRDPG